ncbi:DedA family protein [Saccharopolyspora taberi]|uniref:VTT domain-containing protein n=1 Tax=Saccharopolyspora taberi TaxID=60895 RepID=A0ABN3VCA4_9PSEU
MQSAVPAEPTGFTAWVIGVMEALGGPGAGLIIALENLFPPIPSEVILPLAGFTASRGGMTVPGAILWTTLGSLVGALTLYGIGARLGRERTRAIAARMPLVKLSDVDRTEAWFARHGVKAVFFGRMIPLFRSFISLPAGVDRMRIGTFVLFTTLGSLLWNTVFVLAGFYLGENWHLVEQYAGVLSKAVVVAVVLGLVWFVVKRVRGNREERRVAEAPTEQFAAVGADNAPTEQLPRVR